ncbi:hypothetical protein [Streptomyces alkaliterrae]|uniref:Uncharacterized protein n=1 Tax=Streptomyces alkaliterrae TaxID=2213162 RepID=A0A5P0YRT8_9ACTN|nr:hypothetical protein [Streptomyces alkaliterrae]MBB1255003.1 hypothetical protein [Streptomyces alkaliterrae]MBB1261698.1 hypothetical protein [Streptomyces alkaliterrae]MQS03043.1 hypothetical protein [Streptomyces alkaliterrae]
MAGSSPARYGEGGGMDEWQRLASDVRERLTAASSGERTVFAAGVAERLMRRHESLPPEQRSPFTLGLRPLLDAVWEAALGDTAAFAAVKRGMGEYLLSDYFHNDGQDGPDDADEPAATAVLHATASHLYGCADFAVWAGMRAVDAVAQHVEYLADLADLADLTEGPGSPAPAPLGDPEKAPLEELRRQLLDLDLIAARSDQLRYASCGLPVAATARLQTELRDPLSRQD